jgi:hypothetical protein
VSIDSKSGETHSRHRISRDGFYRGRKVLQTKADGRQRKRRIARRIARRGTDRRSNMAAQCLRCFI